MNKLRNILLPLLLVVAVLLIFQQVGAVSLKELFGWGSGQEPVTDNNPANQEGAKQQQTETKQNWAKPNQSSTTANLVFADIQKLFDNMSATQRQAYLTDEDAFKQFIQQEANNQSVLAAARDNNVDQDDNTAYLMQRSADNVLRESYLNKLIASKLSADFPTDEQVREYYEKNKDGFVLDERLHVWQIFFEFPKEQGSTQTELKDKANRVFNDLTKQKIDFATAAMRYSDHEPSKVNGGYMGLVKVSELKPGIDKALLALPEDKLSRPVTSDTGIHILKRGTIVPQQEVSLDQVRNQIRELLIKQANVQLRQAIYNQAGKTYPVDLKEDKLQEWRLRLQKGQGVRGGE